MRAMFNKGAADAKPAPAPQFNRRLVNQGPLILFPSVATPSVKLTTRRCIPISLSVRENEGVPARPPPPAAPGQHNKPDTVANEVLRRLRERREAERKAEEEAKLTHQTVRSTSTLLDAAAQEKKLREAEERRVAQAAREDMAKRSAYELEHDQAYAHNAKQKELEREAAREAKETLQKFSGKGASFEDEQREKQRKRDEDMRQKEAESKTLHATTSYSAEYDHAYNHAQKLREGELKAEQDAKQSMRHFAGGKTFFDEKMEQRKREEEAERQRVQADKESTTKNNYSNPEFDRGYVRAKQLAKEEKDAEVKAKASLLQYSQQDVSHEMVMINGVRVPRQASLGSQSVPPAPGNFISEVSRVAASCTNAFTASATATAYPFTDPARRVKSPSPAAMKALERFQQNLGKHSSLFKAVWLAVCLQVS